jgi:hypothetical protein
MCNQHTSILTILPCAIFVVLRYHMVSTSLSSLSNVATISISMIGWIMVSFMMGLLPYAYLPWRASYHPLSVWGNLHTWNGIWSIISRADYGTFQLAARGTAGHYARRLWLFWNTFTVETMYVPTFIIVFGMGVGIATSLQRKKGRVDGTATRIANDRNNNVLILVLAMCITLHLVIFTLLSNLSISNALYIAIQKRFYQQPYLFIMIISSLTLDAVIRKFEVSSLWYARSTIRILAIAIAAFSMIACVTSQYSLHYPRVDQHNNRYVSQHATIMLESLPHQSIILCKGDLNTYPLLHAQLVGNIRPDIAILDVELLKTVWYAPVHHRQHLNRIRFPSPQYHNKVNIIPLYHYLSLQYNDSVELINILFAGYLWV